MTTNMLDSALSLSDADLLSRIEKLACTERQASAELVAHLAALELRPSLHAALGYGTLFAYCTQGLRLSEDAACNRIRATRICRRLPPAAPRGNTALGDWREARRRRGTAMTPADPRNRSTQPVHATGDSLETGASLRRSS